MRLVSALRSLVGLVLLQPASGLLSSRVVVSPVKKERKEMKEPGSVAMSEPNQLRILAGGQAHK